MFHSMVTIFVSGQYMQMPLDPSSIPSHHPPNLLPPSIFTHTFSPHSWTSLKLGFFANAASYGVIPFMAFIDVLFISH